MSDLSKTAHKICGICNNAGLVVNPPSGLWEVCNCFYGRGVIHKADFIIHLVRKLFNITKSINWTTPKAK